ncbi:uncharacterized protein LOC114752469 [Neltuma alba]|uniref:uncharacterized protein LOC114738035 n=1 Tax=Neltuma alba TaxID=207710 RepID=UPI0010A3BB31|nr:uncharacterized protein LOC114738035 [Prosopis alba]XP_028797045.1 uncharacterized protein LOC114752469 [Prosopis alba]
MGRQKCQHRAKELLKSYASSPTEIFYLLTLTLLSLLLPLSFLLLARLSGAQYHLQSLITWYRSPNPLPYFLYLALHVNPAILYVLVSFVSVATLIRGLTGKITLFSDSSTSVDRPRLFTAWVLLCTFQVCVGLGIEGSIAAGLYDSDSSFGVERSLLSRVIFLMGLHETMQLWSRGVVKPVVDDTVFGGVDRKERWTERVIMAASLGGLWWWRLREDVETLVVMAEAKKEHWMEVGMADFVGWWLYYLTVTIGMVRVVKALMWMASLCLRGTSPSEIAPVESRDNDDKV